MPLRVEHCSTYIRDFHSERNVVQIHSTLDETGAALGQREVKADDRGSLQISTALLYPTRPKKRSKRPKGKLCERWPLLTARPRRGRDVFVLAFAVQVRNRRGEAGCTGPVSLSRIGSRTGESASPSKCFLSPGMSCWP